MINFSDFMEISFVLFSTLSATGFKDFSSLCSFAIRDIFNMLRYLLYSLPKTFFFVINELIKNNLWGELLMKKIYLISLCLFLVWGCGGGGGSGDSPQAPVVSGGTLSITWNMSQSATVEENSNGATLIDATLNNSTAKLSFSLSGTDSSKFSISNGYLVFTDSPDYENPLDTNVDNSYALTINASGAGISSSHSFSFNVSNVNEAPSLVTDSSAYFQMNENLTEIKQIVASDPENDTLTFSLQNSSASEDEGLLQIDSSTGIVSFKTAPNYELPIDIDTNNTLVFTVAVSDGSFSASKKYYVAVVDVKENPTDISLSPSSVT